MCVPTLAFFPSHSKKSGLSSPEEPETNSIIVPSAKISPALIMRFGAFDSPFTLGFALVFKATSSLTQRLEAFVTHLDDWAEKARFDAIGRLDGTRCLLEWKTSSRRYLKNLKACWHWIRSWFATPG
jgi:hypothetical protein